VRIPKAALPQPKRIQISATQQKSEASVGGGSVTGQQSNQSGKGSSSAQRSTTTSQRERENEKVGASR
jgi:hypothetical protein